MKISFHWPITFERKKRLILLDDTNLTNRVVHALKRAGIFYLNEVPPDGGQYIRCFGKKGQQAIDAEKKRLGIQVMPKLDGR